MGTSSTPTFCDFSPARSAFVAAALKAEREMLLAKVGFDHYDVHAYWRERLAGKVPRRPQLKPLKQ